MLLAAECDQISKYHFVKINKFNFVGYCYHLAQIDHLPVLNSHGRTSIIKFILEHMIFI